MRYTFRTGIGQDGHRFLQEDTLKPCVIGGVIFEETPGFQANSDGDVIFHALCNAITSLTGIPILGATADELFFKQGITDSSVYLKEALKTLGRQEIVHVAVSLEGLRPKILPKIQKLRQSIADVLNIQPDMIGITATTANGLTNCSLGEGMQCTCIVTTQEMEKSNS